MDAGVHVQAINNRHVTMHATTRVKHTATGVDCACCVSSMADEADPVSSGSMLEEPRVSVETTRSDKDKGEAAGVNDHAAKTRQAQTEPDSEVPKASGAADASDEEASALAPYRPQRSSGKNAMPKTLFGLKKKDQGYRNNSNTQQGGYAFDG